MGFRHSLACSADGIMVANLLVTEQQLWAVATMRKTFDILTVLYHPFGEIDNGLLFNVTDAIVFW